MRDARDACRSTREALAEDDPELAELVDDVSREVEAVVDMLSVAGSDRWQPVGSVTDDACPSCGGDLVTGQGVFACPSCGWEGEVVREVGGLTRTG